MSQLNKGKINYGRLLSYGSQTPMVDAVPLAWSVGDRRYALTNDPHLIGWVCTVAGTPGTWVPITGPGSVTGARVPLLSVPFLLDGSIALNTNYGAPATADWQIPGEIPAVKNLFCIPFLGAGVSVPDKCSLSMNIVQNNPTVNVAGGITISIKKQTGAIIGAGACTTTFDANPAHVGSYVLMNVPVADVGVGDSVCLEMVVNPAVLGYAMLATWSLVLSGTML